ncbi:PspA/IM30 family protein [Kamptonema animale CS-326]|jgi:phage shock protein A|uniref:PspA/IM30 family protein n=1 Tax=Kamptonema animale TaxID=92934 RepID=UPI00232AD7D4|nr:PspA/IM30 family protein [Kamptonema animale]MDB9514101.1 PspA/IM30 family protein [Kamptonema animale CS-326]
MGIGNRVLNIIKAKVGSFLTAHEDPELMLNQTIEQMQRELIQHKNAIANVGAAYMETQDKLAAVNKEISVWHQRGLLAVQAGNIQLAQHAAMKKQEAIVLQQSLSNSLAIIAPKFEEYRVRYEDLSAKVSQYKNQKAELTMRVRAAKTQQELDKALSGEFGTAFGQFDELANRIKQFEYQTRAAGLLTENIVSERDFLRLEAHSTTQQQLTEWETRHSLQPATSIPSKYTRTVTTSVTSNSSANVIPPIAPIAPIPPIPPISPTDFEDQFRQLELNFR